MSETTYTSGLITLENLVEETMALARRPESDYKRFFQIAIRGYTDLRLHVVTEGKKLSRLTVSDINRVSFPGDFVDFVNIGVPNNGKIWLLSPDDFVTTTTEVLGLETLDEDYGEGISIPNETANAYYTRGGTNLKGYYNIEWDKRRVALINVVETEVVLCYITSGTSLSGDTYIPVKYIPALQSYMVWWNIALDSSIPVSQKQMAEYTYLRMRNELRKVENASLEEYEIALLRTFYPLAKR